jgi:hypothetical protein
MTFVGALFGPAVGSVRQRLSFVLALWSGEVAFKKDIPSMFRIFYNT